jgi:hypothetical protein
MLIEQIKAPPLPRWTPLEFVEFSCTAGVAILRGTASFGSAESQFRNRTARRFWWRAVSLSPNTAGLVLS